MENNQETGIFIAIGCFVMLALSMGVILFLSIHRRKMLQKERESQMEIFRAANEAQEKEREKIAKNLHDGIVPTLSTIGRSIEQNILNFGSNNFNLPKIKSDLEEFERTVETVRTLSHDLIPQTLLSFGFIEALNRHIKMINTGSMQADFENATTFTKELPFTMPDQLNIFRMCTEILNNLYKHAKYKYLRVSLETEENNLVLNFIHDGLGVVNEEMERFASRSNGLGLKSLKSRALLLNAKLDYSIEDQLACITLQIPLQR